MSRLQRRILTIMDPAVFKALQSRLRDLANCLAKGADMFVRWRVSGELLEVFQWGLDPEIPGLREVWEAAREAHYAAAVDVFTAGSAEVSAVLHSVIRRLCFVVVSLPGCDMY